MPTRMRAAAAALAVLAVGATVAALAAPRPDPNVQAKLDGCTRNVAGLFKKEEPTWVYLGDAGAPASGPPPPAQWARGVVDATPAWLGSHPSDVDDPVSHDSFDFLVNVKADPNSGFLLGGDPTASTGNFAGEAEETGRLHTEWEQAAFASFAWPAPGDRVSLLGNWVWDCGHWTPGGERTELHPLRAVWVERHALSPRSPAGESEGDLVISTDATPAGESADCAHRTKGDRAAFQACLASAPNWQDAGGTYRFSLGGPPRPAGSGKWRVRVVDAGSSPGAPAVTAVPGLNGAVVTVTVAAAPGTRVVIAKKVFVGWQPTAATPKPVHLRVTFERILVRRAMDPGCTAPCTSAETTRTGQISKPPGEWVLYSDVGGIWSQWPLLRPSDGQTIRLNRTLDVYAGRQSPLGVTVTGRECDNGSLSAHSITRPPAPCPAGTGEFLDLVGDDAPGSVADTYRTPAAALGEHVSNSRNAGSSCPPVNVHGCYQVVYRVSRVP